MHPELPEAICQFLIKTLSDVTQHLWNNERDRVANASFLNDI